MDGLVVSAATGALNPILGKLVALLGDEYKRFKGVRGEVEFLTKELTAMHAFLLKMSEEENPDVQDKAWMKEVREMSYDIEDSLDEFMRRVDDRSSKPDGFMNKIKGLLDKTKARRRTAKAFQDLKAQVKQAGDRHARYKNGQTTVSNSNNMTVDQRALAVFKDVSELVGVDGPKGEIIQLLVDESGHTPPQQFKVVSIVGLGGLGKTTIAIQVYRDLILQYQCSAFISVTRNPNMETILRTILSEVKDQPYYKTEAGGIQKLIEEIKTFLQERRYLIVIDDVWDVEAWETIQWAFPKNSCGSRILTTTRKHDVAKSCCSLNGDSVYELKVLNYDDSKRLFSNRIFGPGKEWPSNLNIVSPKILAKCGGLPLAIISVSSMLANKSHNGAHCVKEWEKIQSSIGHGLERDATVKGMMEILSLSYFDLPYHLKACLLYLGVFPEDYIIQKDSLVWKWVAEGFVCTESTCSLYESGEKCFNELINRNLILPGYINPVTGEVESCYVHDTILDFIVSKSIEDNFITVHGIPSLTPPSGNKVRRLILQGQTTGDATLLLNQNYSNVRTLITSGSFVGPPYSLLDFGFMRVLDLRGCRSLQNHHLTNIGDLYHLKYLSLRQTTITELPEQIGELQFLETLDLLFCSIRKLPRTIVRLKRLVNLLINTERIYSIETYLNVPCGIRSMQALEELYTIYVDIKAQACCLEEIGELNKLRNLNIALWFHPDVCKASNMDCIKKLASSIQKLSKLQSLQVQFSFPRGVYNAIFDRDDVMPEEAWCPASVRNLVYTVCPMLRVPSWIESFVNLKTLNLLVKKFEQESLYFLGGLPLLVSIRLEIVTEMEEDKPSAEEQRLLVSPSCGFTRLRFLEITHPGRMALHIGIPMLMFEAGSMPTLEQLHIEFDADITVSVTNVGLDFGLTHLSCLTQFSCHILGRPLIVWVTEAAIRRVLDKHPKVEFFDINTENIADPRKCSKMGRRCLSTDRPVADIWEQGGCQEVADHVIIASGDKTCSSNRCPAALPLPTDLSLSIAGKNVHHQAGKILTSRGRRRHRRNRQSKPTAATETISEHKVSREETYEITGTAGRHGIVHPNARAGTLTTGFLVPQLVTFVAASPADGKLLQNIAPVLPSPAVSSWDPVALSSAFKNRTVHKRSSSKRGTWVRVPRSNNA